MNVRVVRDEAVVPPRARTSRASALASGERPRSNRRLEPRTSSPELASPELPKRPRLRERLGALATRAREAGARAARRAYGPARVLFRLAMAAVGS